MSGSAMCVHDYERAAADSLPTGIWDFLAGGSGDERTVVANRTAWQRLGVLPRVLTGTGAADLTRRLLRTPASMPVAAAPMAYQRLVHPDGELALARGASAAGVPYVLSMFSSTPIEDVLAVGAPAWFQLYWMRDSAAVLELVRRAEQAGCRGVMVTVDVPVMARRLRDVRNEFALPESISAANLRDHETHAGHQRASGPSALAAHTGTVVEPALTWSDLEWLRERTNLPLAVKGILDPRDAQAAVERDVEMIVVSNHGGRQFNGAVNTARVLPEVVAVVDGRAEVLVDSGLRDGGDLLRAVALGADGALLGRPLLWGLACGGAQGVGDVLALVRDELREALVLSGCPDLTAARSLRTAD